MSTPTATPATAARRRLGEALVHAGVISDAQLDVSLRQQRLLQDRGEPMLLGELLVRNRFATQDDVARAMSSGEGADTALPRDAVLLSTSDCVRYQVEPVRIEQSNLVVKSARSLTESQRRALVGACAARVTDVRVQLVDKHEMYRYLNAKVQHESFGALVERLRAQEATPAQLKNAIDALLREAIDLRASDIHLDNKPDPDAWISMRVDADLRQLYLLRTRTMAAVFSRLKTLSSMDASNSRTRQDGRMAILHKGRMVGFRVATQPIVDGETMTLRVLDAAALPTPERLFPNQPRMQSLLSSLSTANGKMGGLVLVTGATGMGKSTTLYTIASSFARERTNVLTVEDPVEFILPFARQIQKRENEIASEVERSVLRQDPDVLIFGEIRDGDSARAALKFAESGHLVLASLHATSPADAIIRVLSMVPAQDRQEAGLVLASRLVSILNQYLVPKLCECAESVAPENIQGEMYAAPDVSLHTPPQKLFRHKGCPYCDNKGYRGRVVMHESMIFDLNESERMHLGRHLSEHGSLAGLQDVNGLKIIRRTEVARCLMEAGWIDLHTAGRFLNGVLSQMNSAGLL